MEAEEVAGMELGQQADASLRDITASLENLAVGMAELRDLFVRRLYEDKQKAALIKDLAAKADYAFIEPFLSDIILLLDRLEKVDDEFVATVYDELLDIIARRGVEQIAVTREFDSKLNRAVRMVEGDPGTGNVVAGIVRNGYVYAGRVVRPAEVVVARGTALDAKGE